MNDEKNMETLDHWERFRYFPGKWKGTGSGNPGESQVDREYRLVLNEQFIQINDRSVYEPQERNPRAKYTRKSAISVLTATGKDMYYVSSMSKDM